MQQCVLLTVNMEDTTTLAFGVLERLLRSLQHVPMHKDSQVEAVH